MTYPTILLFLGFCVLAGQIETVRLISMTGNIVINSTFINVSCATESNPFGNSAEFIVNNVSEDQVRFSNGTCYHRQYVCNIYKCTCTSNGKTFTWTFDTSDYQGNIHIACKIRFADESGNNQFITIASMVYDRLVFIDRGEEKGLPSAEQDQKPNHSDSLPILSLSVIIAVSVLTPILVLCGLYFWFRKRKRKKSRQEQDIGPLLRKISRPLLQSPKLYSIICQNCKKINLFAYCIECKCFMCHGCYESHETSTDHSCVHVKVLCPKENDECEILCDQCRRTNAEVICKTGKELLCCGCKCVHLQDPCNIIPLLVNQTEQRILLAVQLPNLVNSEQIRQKYQNSGEKLQMQSFKSFNNLSVRSSLSDKRISISSL